MVRGGGAKREPADASILRLRWLDRLIEIPDPALATRVTVEVRAATARGEAARPAPLPRLPEHRILPGAEPAYQRPPVATTGVAADLARRVLGLSFPCAVRFEEALERYSAYVLTNTCLALSEGYLEFSFDGYRLHGNGQLTDPVVGLHPFGRRAYRRTLLDEWIEIRPLQEICA